MTTTFAIDWLALYCLVEQDGTQEQDATDLAPSLAIRLAPIVGLLHAKLEPYGTRQYKYLYTIRREGEEVAYIQTSPHSPQLNQKGAIVKFANRVLYRPDFWSIVHEVLTSYNMIYQSISRVDLCKDFNEFLNGYQCEDMIFDFVCSRIRKKGRAVGTLAFRQTKEGLKYSGLSFGKHDSDTRVYLYDKTRELSDVHDKPYIRDFWQVNGLDTSRHVWRLEVSLKAKALKFRDKATGEEIKHDYTTDMDAWRGLYEIFERALFTFVYPDNPNVSRCTLVELLPNECGVIRATLREVTGSGKFERMIVKSLAQMANKYRYFATLDKLPNRLDVERACSAFVDACDLRTWYERKRKFWDDETRIPY